MTSEQQQQQPLSHITP